MKMATGLYDSEEFAVNDVWRRACERVRPVSLNEEYINALALEVEAGLNCVEIEGEPYEYIPLPKDTMDLVKAAFRARVRHRLGLRRPPSWSDLP
jgi:hypothetical protein